MAKNLEDAVANIRLAPWSEKQLDETSRLYNIKPEVLKLAMEMYTKTKLEEQKVDREDIILKAMEILETDPEARAEVQSQCKTLLITDYQDITPLQRAFEKIIKPEDGIKIEMGKAPEAVQLSLSKGQDYLKLDVADNNITYELSDNSAGLHKFEIADIGRAFESERQEKNAVASEVVRRLQDGEEPSDIVILCNGKSDTRKIRDTLMLDYGLKEKLEDERYNPLKFSLYNKDKKIEPSYFWSKEEIEAYTKRNATTVMYGIKSLSEPSNPILFNKFMLSKNPSFKEIDNNSGSPIEDFVKVNTTGDARKDKRVLEIAKAYQEAMKCEMAAGAIKTFLEKADDDKDYKCIEMLEKNNVARKSGLEFVEGLEAELAEKLNVTVKTGIRIKTIQEAKSKDSGAVILYGDARNILKLTAGGSREAEKEPAKESNKTKAKARPRARAGRGA